MPEVSHPAFQIPSMQFDPSKYASQLEVKRKRVKKIFGEIYRPDLEVFPSPPLHFRMRAEFRVWHENRDNQTGECFHAMFDRSHPRVPVRIDQYPVAHKSICHLMPEIMSHINENPVLKQKLFQIEYLSTRNEEIIVTMIYHRPLDDNWIEKAQKLGSQLGCNIIGRSRKQRIVIDHEVVRETLHVGGKDYDLLQGENTFTQPNAAINEQMICWLDDYLTDIFQSDITVSRQSMLEMYCGIGNFTIPLSRHFNRVLATEISKASTNLAIQNCEANGTKNIEFVRLSGEETSEALDRSRKFRRLAHLDLDEFNFSTVLVDPPRAGLDANTLAFIRRFERILYISCNPETLRANLEILGNSHQIARMALFDQFPYTDHCECGAILEKKQ